MSMKKYDLCAFFTNFQNYCTPRLSPPYYFLAFQVLFDIHGFNLLMSSYFRTMQFNFKKNIYWFESVRVNQIEIPIINIFKVPVLNRRRT